MLTLTEKLSRIAHTMKRLSMAELAERLGFKTVWPLYKALNPEEEGHRFPADLIAPFCRLTGSLEPLEHIAAQCGCVVVRVDRIKHGKGDDLPEHGEDYARYLAALTRMYRDGRIDDAGYAVIRRFLAAVCCHAKSAERIATGQGELSL